MNSLEIEGLPQARFLGSPAPTFSRNISQVAYLSISIVPTVQEQALWAINNLLNVGGGEISACATGFVNASAHRERLGWVGASLLAIFITGFVEKFYFALRLGRS